MENIPRLPELARSILQMVVAAVQHVATLTERAQIDQPVVARGPLNNAPPDLAAAGAIGGASDALGSTKTL
ncbi:MAG TPA: hypothetical protein VMF32_24665, partial [Xanthobacteraceae bacterium]|nr:hypothetical protein [Xanthobacteraceae bacterium]